MLPVVTLLPPQFPLSQTIGTAVAAVELAVKETERESIIVT